jgi:hypothetical protein
MSKLLCSCGEVAFVRDVINNPFPDNPTPCRLCYFKMVQVRNQRAIDGKPKGTQDESIRRYDKFIP